MNQRIKYLTPYTLAIAGLLALAGEGAWRYAVLLYAFGLVPLLELFFPTDRHNLTAAEEALAKADRWYDWLIYLTVPLQYGLLGWFFFQMQAGDLSGSERVGLILSMGVLCGTYGINVGHELGHRKAPHERVLAKLALLSSLYLHFYIEHNRGHHKRVATVEDPASSRRGEWVYAFWGRSIWHGYRSAWELETQRLRRQGLPFWSWHNEMLRFQLIQAGLLLLIGLAWGPAALLGFLGAATVGILLLETVNYIEHYGLQRREAAPGRYERVQPHHSWNSNHVIGRLLLFELSRHSDHHFLASRKYQILRHHEDAPQMPTGYPGMMLLALVPPLWFGVMHPVLDRLTPPTPAHG
ncbi:MAG: alkane 1-monooxygenase [Bacteroidetes bacterium]|nr:MAG: alkane 1-monooxygenase [Bacteroidota bacterium]